MGKNLLEAIPAGTFNQVLEIGCGSGCFSNEIQKKYSPDYLSLNDISEAMLNSCKERFKDNRNISYLLGDIEKLSLNNSYDLIASNACLQWLSDLKGALSAFIKALSADGVLAFTSFGNENVKEITSLTHNGLKYLSKAELQSILDELGQPYTFKEEVVRFHYSDALKMLKTLKKTGVTGFSRKIWTKGMLNSFIDDYESRYTDENGVYLTWHLYYVVIRKP